MDEDDTARALRKIPYAELRELLHQDTSFEYLTSEEKTAYLDRCGWTHDELIQRLFDELDKLQMP